MLKNIIKKIIGTVLIFILPIYSIFTLLSEKPLIQKSLLSICFVCIIIFIVKYVSYLRISSLQNINLTQYTKSNTIIFKLTGEINDVTMQRKSQKIEEFIKSDQAKSMLIVLDFSNLKFFISAFLGKIADWIHISQKKNSEISIINTSKYIFDVLDMVGITKLIKVTKKDNYILNENN